MYRSYGIKVAREIGACFGKILTVSGQTEGKE